jgi:hypothetical protein
VSLPPCEIGAGGGGTGGGGGGGTGAGNDDKLSWALASPAGAARAESDDDDDDTANDARIREELVGNLMKNDSSGRNWCRSVGFRAHPLRIFVYVGAKMTGRIDVGQNSEPKTRVLVGVPIMTSQISTC